MDEVEPGESERTVDPAALRARLRHVYWIGGGSGAGKSTIARRIAARTGMRVYSTDDAMAEHARRGSTRDVPYLREFTAMSMDERWVDRTPEEMLETFHWFRGEGFASIVEDLLDISDRTVVEGFRLLPHLVGPLLADPARAIWLLPTPRLRRDVFAGRGWVIPSRTSDPDRARHNLLRRDEMFTDRLRAETERLGLPVLEVDENLTEDDSAGYVTRAFGL
ncbi:AAA family ATPase [Nocardia sp. NBC_00416]|uniref:AAA family ATPase n=1 Tax=Nocardia sp. NBC_00416 TaxID=2975991 RepID=UPI002E1CA4FF